jgi:hypothetical protein
VGLLANEQFIYFLSLLHCACGFWTVGGFLEQNSEHLLPQLTEKFCSVFKCDVLADSDIGVVFYFSLLEQLPYIF